MRNSGRLTLLALAVLLVVLVLAVPAQAGTVKKGSSQMTIGAAYVTELAKLNVTPGPVAPATMKVKFTSKDQMYYWFRVPMVKTSGKYTSNWSPSTGKGTFYHSGSIRFVEASATAHKIFRAEGIRIIANSKTSYTMSVSYKPVSGPYLRVSLATSTHAPKITHSGKSYKIDGVQFILTKEGHDAIESVLGAGESFDVTKVIFATDLLPVLQ
jgi:hypothetical protein